FTFWFSPFFFFSSRRRHTRFSRDWSSDVCSSDLGRRCAADDGGHLAQRHRPGDEPVEVEDAGGDHVGGPAVGMRIEPGGFDAQQIGRASCRERAKLEGWAGSLKRQEKRHNRYTTQ